MCDLLCATPAASGGPMLFAKNSDRPPDEAQVWEWHPAGALDDRTTVTHVTLDWRGAPGRGSFGVFGSRPAWGWGMEHGVNGAGLAAGNATIYTPLDPRGAPVGLTGMDIVRLVLQHAGNARDALALVEWLVTTVGQGGSGHQDRHRPYWSSFLIADPREALVIETSGSEIAVELVTDVRATSNRTTIPGFAGHPRQPVDTLVEPRLAASRAVLATRPVTVAALEEHLSSHVGGDDGWTVCMHVEGPDHAEATTSSMVAELPRGRPPIVHHALGSPCRATWTTTRLDDL